jgi:hypothetical protein
VLFSLSEHDALWILCDVESLLFMLINVSIWCKVGIAQWYSSGLRAGWSGVRVSVRAMINFFLLVIMSRPAMGSTQSPTQWVPGALSWGVKRPGRAAHYSLPSSTEVRMRGAMPSFLQCLHGFLLSLKKKHRDNFTFTSVFLKIGPLRLFLYFMQYVHGNFQTNEY